MADEADIASIQQQYILDAAIKNAQGRSLDTTNINGVCWSCGKATGIFKRWCGVTCRDEWDRKK